MFQPTAGANPGRCPRRISHAYLPGMFQPTAGANPGRCGFSAITCDPLAAPFQPTAGANPGRCVEGVRLQSERCCVSTHGRGEPRPLRFLGALTSSYVLWFQPTAGANPGRCHRAGEVPHPTAVSTHGRGEPRPLQAGPQPAPPSTPAGFNPRPGRTPAAAVAGVAGRNADLVSTHGRGEPRPLRRGTRCGSGDAIQGFQPTAGANPGRCRPLRLPSPTRTAPYSFNPRPGRTPAAARRLKVDTASIPRFQPTAGANPGRCVQVQPLTDQGVGVSTHGRGEPRPLQGQGPDRRATGHVVSTHGRGEPRPLPSPTCDVTIHTAQEPA